MPGLAQHHSSKLFKFIYIGDSGTGKTGSLTSLVKAGYKVRILDFDNGVDTLAQYVRKECPEHIGNVDYETLRDKVTATQVGPIIRNPTAFTKGLEYMTKWPDGSSPGEWGEKTIFVLDSLSNFGRAAFAWAKGMNPSAKDPRQWYFAAQQGLEDVIALLTGETFRSNVIVISHVNYKEVIEGVHKGYANAIGTALGPTLPRYFNTLVLAETSGVGKNVKREIKMTPTGVIDLKTPVPELTEALPLSTGLATLVEKLHTAL